MNTRMGITPRTEAAVGMQPTQGPTTSSQLTANDRQSPGVGPIPAPPPSPPILGEKVSLDEARRRTPYTIPIPPDGVVGADIQEVWASKEGAPTEFRQVYLIYANGLKISIGGRPDAIDYSALADDPFRAANVRGIPASGKDPAVKTLSTGGQVNTPANLSWWVNQVDIGLYHPTWSMEQLLEIGEAMPDPIWSPTTTRALPTFTPVPTVGVSTPTVVPSVAPTPLSSPVPPQPLPSIYLDYKDRLHQGWRGSVCWPYQVNMGSVKWGSSCPATAGWRGFDEVSPITIKSEDQFSMVIAAHTPPDRLMTRMFTVLSTVPALSRGEELFRHDARSPGEAEEITLGLPPGVYYLDASASWLAGSIVDGSPEGSVGYGFKVEIVD